MMNWRPKGQRPAPRLKDFPGKPRGRLEEHPHLLALRKMKPEVLARALRKLIDGANGEQP